MLEKLTLRNFQSHASLKLTFAAGCTTIVGSSDVGKTAALRALQWLAFNKPGGDQFIRHGEDHVEVSLKCDGRRVGRLRGPGQNTYELDGEVFKSFGAEPPALVAELLNLRPANVQNQHDSPFWFSETGGAVSRSLNQIINLGAIDDTLAYLSQRARQAKARTTAAEERVAVTGERWETLKEVKQTDRALQHVEVLLQSAKMAEQKALGLTQALAGVEQYARTADRAAGTATAAATVLAVGSQWAGLVAKRDKLASELKGIPELQRRAKAVYPSTAPLFTLHTRYKEARAKVDALRALVEQAGSYADSAAAERERATAADAEFKKKLGVRCPLCGKATK